MGIIEATRALGVEIQKDERYIRYAKAKLDADNATDLQNKIGEFNMTRMNLENEMSAENRNEEKISELNETLRKIYGEVMSSEVMMAFNTAKAELDSMFNDVNSMIGQVMDGADPQMVEPQTHSCSGSCSTCGGCG